jgi:dihydrofolate reductase
MIRLISAIDQKRGIAKNGVQPWNIPADEQYFYEQTISHGAVVLMGQKTFEVIGHPLKERQNYVLSRHVHSGDGVIYIQDLDKFLHEQENDIWIIGGASLFEQGIVVADELYLTHIEADFGCDQFFPEYEHVFDLKQTSDLHTQNGFIFTYSVYTKL